MPRIVSWSDAEGPVDRFATRLRVDHPGETVDVDYGRLAARHVYAHLGFQVRSAWSRITL